MAITTIADDLVRFSVAPITHAPPQDRAAIALPLRVKAHLKLDERPSWVICDEINQFDWPSTDVANVPGGGFTYGRLPAKLLKEIQSTLVKSGRIGRLKITNRDE